LAASAYALPVTAADTRSPALIGTRARAGVHRLVDAIRCEFDNWVQCEYKRDELLDDVFFDLYYHELPDNDSLAAGPTSWDRHIASLDEVKATLVRYYPECRPLSQLLKKADLAIASLRNWNIDPTRPESRRSRSNK